MGQDTGRLGSESDIPMDYRLLLQEWQGSFDKEAAWSGADNDLERLIIRQAPRPRPSDRWLYRGQGIPDAVAADLAEGRTVVIEPTRRLISSWTYDLHVAYDFAGDACDDRLSAVVLAVPDTDLELLALIEESDCGLKSEDEMICKAGPLRITPADILALWVYDEALETTRKIELPAQSTPKMSL